MATTSKGISTASASKDDQLGCHHSPKDACEPCQPCAEVDRHGKVDLARDVPRHQSKGLLVEAMDAMDQALEVQATPILALSRRQQGTLGPVIGKGTI